MEQLTKKVSLLAEHPNLESGEGKRAFQRYAFLLKSYDTQGRTRPFIQLTHEIVQAVDFYIVRPNTEAPATIPVYSVYDIANWLDWLDSYLHNAANILDKVVLEDHSINFDELKTQIKAELYERLRPELHEQLYTELKAKLYAEISEELTISMDNSKPNSTACCRENYRKSCTKTCTRTCMKAYTMLYMYQLKKRKMNLHH